MDRYITPSLFPDFNWDECPIKVMATPHMRWEAKKTKNFGLELCTDATFSGKYGIPKLKKYMASIPRKFITLDRISETGDPATGILGFSHDFALESFALNINRFIPKLRTYACVAELDFSTRVMDPLASVISNVFRSHCLAYYLQEKGCPIMPTMKWADERSYEVCFDGYEKGGSVLISTIGIHRDERSRMYFTNGFKEMLRRISPDAIVIYGEIKEWILKLIPSQLDYVLFKNEHINRMRDHGRKRSI